MRPKRIGFAPTLAALLVPVLLAVTTSCSSASDATSSADAVTTSTGLITTTTLSPAQTFLGSMTLREKAAQVLLLTFSGTTLTDDTASLLKSGPPGGLLVLGHNVVDPEQMKTLTSAMQQEAAATGSPVGLFIAVDQEGGRVQRIKQGVPELPSAREMSEDSTPDSAYYLALETARGLQQQGINMNLAPVADVVDDKSSFLYGRTYGGDPARVSDFVTSVVEAHLEQRLISVVKHFPGHGSAPGNTHTQGAVSSETEEDYDAVHLVPFRAAIKAQVPGVMTAHIVAAPYDPLRPASLSKSVIEDLLRGQLGFEGIVVADDVSMAAAIQTVAGSVAPPTTDAQSTSDQIEQAKEQFLVAKEVLAVTTALNAGCDLVILTELETRAQAVLQGLVAAIKQGKVSQARLDEAVLRILELKFEYGIVAAGPIHSVSTTSTTGTTETPQED